MCMFEVLRYLMRFSRSDSEERRRGGGRRVKWSGGEGGVGGERREERRETRWRPSEVDDGGNGGGSSFSFSLAQLDAIFLPLSRPFLMLFVSNRPRRLCRNVRDSPTRVDWRIAGNGKGEGERRNEEIGKKTTLRRSPTTAEAASERKRCGGGRSICSSFQLHCVERIAPLYALSSARL